MESRAKLLTGAGFRGGQKTHIHGNRKGIATDEQRENKAKTPLRALLKQAPEDRWLALGGQDTGIEEFCDKCPRIREGQLAAQ